MKLQLSVFLFTAVSSLTHAQVVINVGSSVEGQSIKYIGSNGGDRFNLNAVVNSGVNIYRVFTDLARAQPNRNQSQAWCYDFYRDLDPARGGNPSRISQIVNWAAFDQSMLNGQINNILKPISNYNKTTSKKIAIDMVIRPKGNWGNSWVPRSWSNWTSCDTLEWQRHVISLVYFLNVMKGLDISFFNIGNEPNQSDQGWQNGQGVSTAMSQYKNFVIHTKKALDFAFKYYLNGRSYQSIAGSLSQTSSNGGWQQWASQIMSVSSNFNYIALHPYGDKTNVSTKVSELDAIVRGSKGIFLTEFGQLGQSHIWSSLSQSIDRIANTLVMLSQPGSKKAEGAIIWSAFDDVSKNRTTGLFYDSNKNYQAKAGAYVIRLSAMALAGGRSIQRITSSNPTAGQVNFMATKNPSGGYDVLISNKGSQSYSTTLTLDAVLTSGTCAIYQLSSSRLNESSYSTPISTLQLNSGDVKFNLPATSLSLARCK